MTLLNLRAFESLQFHDLNVRENAAVAAVGSENLKGHLLLAREMAVVRHVTAIHQVQAQYYAQFGRYAKSLPELGPPVSGPPGPPSADLLPKTLSEGTNGGYTYTVSERPDGYVVNANPERFGTSGRRTFYSDHSLIIRENWTADPATAASSAIR